MFKIVETIEKGNKELTVVPKRWEQCGTLFWPKKFAYKYQQDPKSAPDPNWMFIPCKTKRQGFASFRMAEAELSKMLDTNESITENEEQQSPSTILIPLLLLLGLFCVMGGIMFLATVVSGLLSLK
ncbi:hypothetical protein JTB14_010625 [Gonioctena quinquepunctata]|nr:hypothetical protein JTB14_010625 [Gonioctena quinquepunctata]